MPCMTSELTRKVTLDLLTAVQANDIEAIKLLYAESVDFSVSWPAGEIGGRVPWLRERRNAEDMARHFRDIADANQQDGEGTTVSTIVVEGKDAIVLGTIRNRLIARDKAYEARFALHLTVDDGRIIRHHVYEDSLSVYRAFQ